MITEDFFYHNFDEHEGNREKFEAACRHLSWIINATEITNNSQISAMTDALSYLRAGNVAEATIILYEALRKW